MTDETNDPLIDALVDDLAPVRRPPGDAASLALWLAVSWTVVLGATLAAGPLRPGALDQLVTTPRFLLECLAGAAAGVLAMAAALRLATPGRSRPRRAAAPALGLAALWVAQIAVGWSWPSLEVSTLGKRPHCFVEILAYSVPPLLLGLWLLRRRLALERFATAALLAGASASLPALLMQLACRYEPTHGLLYHLGPLLLVAAFGSLAGRLLPRPA